MGAAENPTLIDAARAGDRATVKTLVQKGANVNAAEGDGTTALHWASYRDDVEAADVLLKAGAKVNAANDLGATALWTASLNGSSAMVRRLLQAGANPNLGLLSGETPMMVAARSGAPEVVAQLIGRGANVNARGARDQTALMWAVAQHHPDVVKVLLAHGADISVKSEVWSQVMAVSPHGFADYNKNIPHGGETALMFAARVGDLPSAQLLVAAGANVNDADAWGVSATTLAAHAGFTEVVEFLLSKGADASAEVAGFSALHCAIMRRDEKMVAALLDHGANPNAPLRTWTPTRRSSADFNFEPPLVGSTPFWLAARFTEPGVMRLLLKRGADPSFVHRSTYWSGEPAIERQQITTAVMAAAGMGGAARVGATRRSPARGTHARSHPDCGRSGRRSQRREHRWQNRARCGEGRAVRESRSVPDRQGRDAWQSHRGKTLNDRSADWSSFLTGSLRRSDIQTSVVGASL